MRQMRMIEEQLYRMEIKILFRTSDFKWQQQ
jgi:hypothetical protein